MWRVTRTCVSPHWATDNAPTTRLQGTETTANDPAAAAAAAGVCYCLAMTAR